jgi:hypothetical protein
VHKINYAIILHLKIWHTIDSFLMLIVCHQVAQTDVLIVLCVCSRISVSIGPGDSYPAAESRANVLSEADL